MVARSEPASRKSSDKHRRIGREKLRRVRIIASAANVKLVALARFTETPELPEIGEAQRLLASLG